VIDPDIELLPDVPIAGPDGDLFARKAVAERLVELASAAPIAAPRVVALTGGAGTGKTSLLRMATALLADRGGAAAVVLDGAAHAGAETLLAALTREVSAFFAAAGVVGTRDAVRDKLAEYGGIVSSIARLARINVDVAGAMRRSPDSLRDEIAEMTQEVGKRIVIVIDHADRLPPHELAAFVDALHLWAEIPYLAFVLAIDRRAVAARAENPFALERLFQVELALPAPDRTMLARVMAGGLERVATRLTRDLDPALDLFDPDGGVALELIETPRDAKRAVNAAAAALPLLPAGTDLRTSLLDAILRLLVPELDGPRLDARTRATTRVAREALHRELCASIAGHRRAPGAIAALGELLLRP
jgi:hypothetical protein